MHIFSYAEKPLWKVAAYILASILSLRVCESLVAKGLCKTSTCAGVI